MAAERAGPRPAACAALKRTSFHNNFFGRRRSSGGAAAAGDAVTGGAFSTMGIMRPSVSGMRVAALGSAVGANAPAWWA